MLKRETTSAREALHSPPLQHSTRDAVGGSNELTLRSIAHAARWTSDLVPYEAHRRVIKHRTPSVPGSVNDGDRAGR